MKRGDNINGSCCQGKMTRKRYGRVISLLVGAAALLVPFPVAIAEPMDKQAHFLVAHLHVEYFNPVGAHWSRGLGDLQIALGKRGEVYTAASDGGAMSDFMLGTLLDPGMPRTYSASALLEIDDAIRKYFERQGLLAVKVYIDPSEVQQFDEGKGESKLVDMRAAGNTDLHIVVLVGRVGEVRTISSGSRVGKGDRVDNRIDAKIRSNSPIQPMALVTTQPTDLNVLRKKELDDYVFRLNRLPGRRVDAVVSPNDVPGAVTLDYLVQENKPWSIYGQVSNTGTHQTKPLRERFGFLDTQLTGNDDVLSMDYSTADFDDASQAVLGSYEFPVLQDSTLRARLYGSYSSFVASDVGLGSENFSGNQSVAGAELIDNFFQDRALFLDAFGGMRFESISSASDTTGIEGSADAGIPYLGLRLQRATEKSSLFASATGEMGFTEADQSQLDGLGRTDVDKHWGLVQGEVDWSFFLEPVITPKRFEQGSAAMANEVAFSVRGQSALGSRLMPEEQQTVGGLYTVRGYPESLTSGDDMLLASAEYRFHVPRAFAPNANPQPLGWGGDEPFRWVPDRPGGQTDWDLILKAFVDGARVWQSDRAAGEDDSALLSIGIGAEFQFKQSLNAQVYWGVALTDVNGPAIDESVKAGDSRVSFSVTLFY
jgi:hemolysin activation/secretion protein